FGIGQHQLLAGERGEPRVVRGGAQRAGENENFGGGHWKPENRGQTTPGRIGNLAPPVVRPPSSVSSMLAIDPYPRRRDVGPDALRDFRADTVERLRDRRDRRVSELHE